MKNQNTRLKRALAMLSILLPTLAVTACLNTEPKVLGQQGTFNFSAFNGAGVQGSFVFNFALLTTGAPSTVALQGSDNALSAIVGTCNLAGTSCQCNFLNSAGATLGSTSSSQITYDQTGNYLTCTVPNTISSAAIAQVTVSNLNSTVVSTAMTVNSATNPLTLNQLIGSSLDANHVRSVSRYQCEYNYLQKAGTSTAGFDCTNQAVSCDPDGTLAKNFCIMKARYPFYLYADTYSTNFSAKIPDTLYGTTASPTICGLSIKQINCVQSDIDPSVGGTPDTFGTPVNQFGVYGLSTGIWQSAISLPPGPNQASASVGYAAAVSPTTGNCPPGLVKRIFFTTNVDPSAITPASNFITTVATEVADPTLTPTALTIQKLSGGTGGFCSGLTCSLPTSQVLAGLPTWTYTSTGQTAFCVLPASVLP